MALLRGGGGEKIVIHPLENMPPHGEERGNAARLEPGGLTYPDIDTNAN
jgi:hypothetical protein